MKSSHAGITYINTRLSFGFSSLAGLDPAAMMRRFPRAAAKGMADRSLKIWKLERRLRGRGNHKTKRNVRQANPSAIDGGHIGDTAALPTESCVISLSAHLFSTMGG